VTARGATFGAGATGLLLGYDVVVHPADFYTGIVPTVYAALRGTHFGTDRYRDFINEVGSPALELGCGDDGPFFDLADAGFDITGVDASIDMVRRGRERLAAQGLAHPIFHQRMEDLDLGRRFAAIYLAGPTFNLLADDETALQALKAIARHLLPGGAVLVPLWVPSPTPPAQFGAVQIAEADGAEVRYIVESEIFTRSTHTRTTSVRYELGTGPEAVVEHRNWIIHWYDNDGFQRLVENAGFQVSFVPVDSSEVEAVLRLAS
jgi:SAM-dependent methyltransferase